MRSLPRASFTAPTPASGATVGGQVTLAVNATPPTAASSSVAYGFDAAGFRRSRTLCEQGQVFHVPFGLVLAGS